jgi:hypothetical protein
MRIGGILLALLLSSLEGFAQEPPPAIDVLMTCKPPAARDREPKLLLSGTTGFPDGTLLRFTITRMFESLASGRLTLVPELGPSVLVEVEGKKYRHAPLIGTPGIYLVSVQFIDDLQKESVLAALKNKVTKRIWQFQFSAWTDELVGQLGPRMGELGTIAKEGVDIIARVEKLAGNESSWVAERKNVDFRGADVTLTKEAQEVMKDCSKLLMRLEKVEGRNLFPAAHGEIMMTFRTMIGNAQRFDFQNGKFAGAKNYHAPTQPMPNHRDEPFNFENAKRYLEEVPSICGREMGLWIVKDLDRTQGVLRPDLLDALKTYAKQPGLDGVSDRLSKATLQDLKPLEEELRGKTIEKPKDAKPPTPPTTGGASQTGSAPPK